MLYFGSDFVNFNGAVEYQQAKKEVHKLLRDKIVVGHSLKNDFKVLELATEPQGKWSDTYVNGA